MEVTTGALPSVITKLGDLIAGEYNLQKGLKKEISFLKEELESIQVAVEKVSNTLPDQLDKQDKLWARDLRELSYDIEDNIDTFMVRGNGKGKGSTELHGIKEFIGRSFKLFSKFRIRRGLATEIRDIKSRVEEVSRRHRDYKISNDVIKPVTIDPRLFSQYKNVRDLVGIDDAREEVIKILMEGNGASKQQNNIVSIVGFGGLGKTTIANVVYEELKTQFDCSAFVSVSQAPDMEKILNDMLHQLGMISNASISNIVRELTEFLQYKRYFIVLDDIWKVSTWKEIQSSLPANDFGNRIIITTRNVDVAEEAGGAYKLKPLSLNNSRKLFYWKVFGNENNEDIEECPNEELAIVSDKILKKCAGVPLAIVTMASLLACKGPNIMEWYEVYNSVGTGLQNNFDVDNMRKILSLSYYDMPSHLRTCLLYLSMFPEDYYISKDNLIWRWIAEGFIHHTKPQGSLYELGESYFNELINRSMIQPEYGDAFSGFQFMISGCSVHDMVLDLLCSLSSEENFVTTLNDAVGLPLSKKVRRLSLQNSTMTDHAAGQVATMSMKQVRSVVVLQHGLELLPALSRFRVLRVLDLEECYTNLEDSSLKYLGHLVHLRYLGLGEINNLPEEIGNLRFLQTLLITISSSLFRLDSTSSVLPSSIVQLKHMICLRGSNAKVPNGIGNLTSLEELSGIYIDSIEIIEEMGNLSELRVLNIDYTDALLDKSFVECLCKLRKIQIVKILNIFRPNDKLILDGWVAPQHLRVLELEDGGFSKLPAWMNPSFLRHLCFLKIHVDLHQEDFEILGNLPALRSLHLRLGHEWWAGLPRKFTTAAGSFPCLVHFKVKGYVQPLEFQQGAMPRLEILDFTLLWSEMLKIWVEALDSGRVDWTLGLRNLSSLKHVIAYTRRYEGKEAEDALRYAVETHPNQPTVTIIY